ncbi:hypothetical protein GCM10007377_04500 [Galliscardovia ingluviei]|uniref:Uncharacterized protein n=1 Tax=Galliscardovia ingluviei TaxID=1769422 RepID=A0A8J3F1A4_9BIFI|nr:hypothetical protein [Galliscardovia ingluviei]GGI13146.1 hypothetical protein GCM10007377_04500 [Galliscardovia ingluviei]
MFKKFFKDVSFVPIIAGALAAVTSFLLSAHIGIAGSVIGVAIGSVVSAIASQVYQNVLRESGRKLQENLDFLPSSNSSTNSQQQDSADALDHTTVIDTQHTQVMDPIDETTEYTSLQHSGQAAGQGRVVQSSRVIHTPSRRTESAHTKATDTYFAHQNKRTQRKIMLVAILSALLAVGVTAGVILAVTHGEGTDNVVRTIVVPEKKQHTDQDSTLNNSNLGTETDNNSGNADNGKSNESTGTTNSDQTSDNTGSSTGTTQDSEQNASNGSSDTGTGSTSGNHGNSSDSTSTSDGSSNSGSTGSSTGSGSDSSSTNSGSSGNTTNQGSTSSGSSTTNSSGTSTNGAK